MNVALDHVPVLVQGKAARCQMHGWLGFKKKKGGVMLRCTTCEVVLCSECYDDYHKVKHLAAIKPWLQEECFVDRRERPDGNNYWRQGFEYITLDYVREGSEQNRLDHVTTKTDEI
jgi:hypothetical protein